MVTWRDLSLPGSREVWRELRALRAGITGPAQASGQRRAVFVAALEQAEQFTQAASAAGPATRPVQVFYALSQFGRALAACSGRLGDGDWASKGHGIGTRNLDARQGLALVEVVPSARGLLTTVARALGAEPLPPQVPLTLGQLWPLIPETELAPLPGAMGLPALHFVLGGTILRDSALWSRLSLYPVPTEIRVRADTGTKVVDDFLRNYPTLDGWSHTPDVAETVLWRERGNGAAEELEVFLPTPFTSQDLGDSEAEALQRATLYRSSKDAYAFPALPGMAGPVHPLLAWWALLFGLSILARYEPAAWAKIIDIDRSVSASAVEHVLDQALVAVPHVALLTIKDAAAEQVAGG
ncbi:YaaC family protein [Streptomyces sp. NPDC016845]|uniref:YaaC family protein n=1 Tax=Streptomyces sp. NPDC016845 TaxID=3364972 RepID=UPI00378C3582